MKVFLAGIFPISKMKMKDKMESKERLDTFLVRKGYFISRDRANEAVKQGFVVVNGKVIVKPAFLIDDKHRVKLLGEDFDYVSRAALKLKSAVQRFGINVDGKICLDIGVATGGFSDYLLSEGAALVYGIDVGEGQISSKLVNKKNFVFKNFTDARDLVPGDFSKRPELIVIDVSFISITKLIPILKSFFCGGVEIIALIKPQYEVGKNIKLTDSKKVEKVLFNIKSLFEKEGLQVVNEMPSAVSGKSGTQEYFFLIR